MNNLINSDALASMIACKQPINLRSLMNELSLERQAAKLLLKQLNKKTDRVEIRLSRIRKSQLQHKARESKLTLSQLIDTAIDRAKIVVPPAVEIHQHNINTNRINANLNMIARWVNTHKSDVDTLAVIKELLQVRADINQINDNEAVTEWQ